MDTTAVRPDCRERAHLGEGLVEVEVLLIADIRGTAQPERLVLVEQVPVPHCLLHSRCLRLLLFVILILLICMQSGNQHQALWTRP